MNIERVQKFLSSQGFGSRRKIEKMILSEKIYINNKKIFLGDKINTNKKNIIKLNNVLINCTLNRNFITRVLLYNKPQKEISTSIESDMRKTIFSNLPKIYNSRWISVGRLDFNTEGIIFFTNNGELANRLMHPKYKISRKYLVKVYGNININKINKLKKGILLNNKIALFQKIEYFYENKNFNKWFIVTLSEGRNREVKRLWNSVGISVSKLIRLQYAGFSIPNKLLPGCWIELNKNEVVKLLKKVNL
ncbi:pseudouridine synthase [Buchnera aphidicola (Kurisakia onigurumii)]|uniref:pseudouridine synthase n=1 Tax=Buchnera aphidicola TaxID=9 RepID=UPI0031B731B6